MDFPSGFSATRAIELGELVLLAYDQFSSFEDEKPWKLPAEFELLREIKYTMNPESIFEKKGYTYDIDVKRLFTIRKQKSITMPIGFIARRKKNIYIIFRGTKTAKEWINNFSMGLKEYPVPGFGNVHEGFLQAYNLNKEGILGTIEKVEKGGRLFIAGHSLGAALATLALPDIEKNANRRVRTLYTFGSPRVGDAQFARSFGQAFGNRSFRIANSSDIVSSIPLPVPLFGLVGGYFSHVDRLVDFNVQNQDAEQNHSMGTYLAALAKARGENGFIRRLLYP